MGLLTVSSLLSSRCLRDVLQDLLLASLLVLHDRRLVLLRSDGVVDVLGSLDLRREGRVLLVRFVTNSATRLAYSNF